MRVVFSTLLDPWTANLRPKDEKLPTIVQIIFFSFWRSLLLIVFVDHLCWNVCIFVKKNYKKIFRNILPDRNIELKKVLFLNPNWTLLHHKNFLIPNPKPKNIVFIFICKKIKALWNEIFIRIFGFKLPTCLILICMLIWWNKYGNWVVKWCEGNGRKF